MGAFNKVYFISDRERIRDQLCEWFVAQGKQYWEGAALFLFRSKGDKIEFAVNFSSKAEDFLKDLSSRLETPCGSLELADGELTMLIVADGGQIVFREVDNRDSGYLESEFEAKPDYMALQRCFPELTQEVIESTFAKGLEDSYHGIAGALGIHYMDADDGYKLAAYYPGEFETIKANVGMDDKTTPASKIQQNPAEFPVTER